MKGTRVGNCQALPLLTALPLSAQWPMLVPAPGTRYWPMNFPPHAFVFLTVAYGLISSLLWCVVAVIVVRSLNLISLYPSLITTSWVLRHSYERVISSRAFWKYSGGGAEVFQNRVFILAHGQWRSWIKMSCSPLLHSSLLFLPLAPAMPPSTTRMFIFYRFAYLFDVRPPDDDLHALLPFTPTPALCWKSSCYLISAESLMNVHVVCALPSSSVCVCVCVSPRELYITFIV